MRGRVLAFDSMSGSGLISGADGQRYRFAQGALQGGYRSVATGVFVVASGWEKNRIVAAVLALFLGHWGVHKFYLGKTNAGIIMLLMGTVGWLLVIPALANWVIAIIEFIIYLTKSDQQFYQDYVVGDRTWF